MFQTKVAYKMRTYILGTIAVFLKSCRLWDNVEKYAQSGRAQMTIWRMRIACWKPTATNTHSVYVILIALPLQQWLHERASMLRDTYIACLVTLYIGTVVLTLNKCLLHTLTLSLSPATASSFNGANRPRTLSSTAFWKLNTTQF